MSFKPFEGELDADSKFVPFDGELDGEPAEDLSKPYIGFKPPMTKAAQGVGEAVVGEGERLRDAVFSGVDNVRAGFNTMGFAQRASRVQTLQSQVAEMEARGDGDSLAAQSLRREIKGVQQSLPESAEWAASAQADAKRGGAMTTTPVMQEMAQAKTFGEAWEAFKKAPYDVISTITAQSMPAILPALATAAVAGPVPGALAMGASSGVTEAGSSLGKFASDAGVDVTDPKALQTFFSDPENMSRAMAFAGKRAGIIATADAVSGGIAGKIIAPAMRSGVARQAVNMPAQMGVQAGLGAGGEAGAQLATEGKISSPGEVLMEAVGELGGAPMEVATFGREARRAERPITAPIDEIAPAQTTDEAIIAAARALDAQPAQAVANIERILGEGNVSTPTAVPPSDTGAPGGGGVDAAPSLDTGVGIDGAGLGAGMEQGSPAGAPAGAAAPAPAADPLAALRTENAALRAQAIQALESQQVSAAPAGPVPAARGDEPAAQLPPAGPATLEAGGVAAPSARQVAADSERARIEEQRARRRAAAQEASKPMEGLSVGSMPTNAEPVSVKDGVVYVGKYPAQNFDTGEDVTVPAGATPQQIVAALKESGALGKRAKFFGLPANESPAQTTQKPEPTLASPEQQRADFAAAEKARTAPGNRARARAHDANPFKAFIAKHGISAALAAEFAPGRKERQAALVQGYGPVFRKSGLQLDALAELAVQDGYLTTPDVTKLAAMIGEVLRGKRVIPQYAEGAVETEMESRAALEKEAGEEQNAEVEAETRAEREAIQALAELSDESLQALASDDAVLTAGNNVSEADFLRALGASEQEIEDATQGQGRKGQDDQGRPGPQETAAGAAPRGAESRDGETRSAAEGLSDAARTDKAGDEKPQAPDATGSRVARPGAGSRKQNVSSGQDTQGLTAPSREDVVAQQNRAEAGAKAEAKAKTDTEQRARADSELPDFTLTGSDRPADQAEARGQGGLFDRPASELSAAQLLRAAADKMEVRAEQPAAKPAEAAQPKAEPTATSSNESPQEPMFSRAAPVWRSALRDGVATIQAKAQGAEGWRAQIQGLVNKGAVKADEVEWSGVNDWLKLQTGKVTKEQVLEYLDGNGVQVEEVTLSEPGEARSISEFARADTSRETKYEEYTLPGGTNYREVLLTLPGKTKRVDDATAKRLGADKGWETDDPIYQSSHWKGVQNVLAHIRVNDRTDADGKRVLFVEEIQSDWGQEGKKKGFGKPENRIYAPGLGDKPPVPSAPFVTKTDAWLNLALKRVITMAAEGGYDKVAFINGEQSAERYDLSKQIDAITARQLKDGSYELGITLQDGKLMPRFAENESELSDLVGKEMAKKIVEGTTAGKRAHFKGLDLKVGGEGMKAFYDQIVPSAVKKLLPKVGGGQIHDVSIASVKNVYTVSHLANDTFAVRMYPPNAEGEGVIVAGGIKTRERAKEVLAEMEAEDKGPGQPGFDITPAMREKAAQGLPMFARNANGEEGQLPAIINPSNVANVQKAITELLGGKQLTNSLGRIVATTAAEIKSTWEPLIGKNVQIGSEGEAGVAQAFFEPGTKTVFMIADHINEGAETAVLAHELMHKHGQTVLGEAGWNRLHSLIGTWKDADEDSDERFVYDYATRKVQAVGEELSTQELFPYAVEAAIRMGIKPSLQAKRGTVANWLESVRQSLKTVWGRITGKPETFKAQDLVDLAFGIAQMENPEGADVLRGALTSQTETPAEGDIRYSNTEGMDMEAEQKALQALSESDELFALPKSDKTTVAEIAAENDPDIKVRQTKIVNETLYTLTMPSGETAKLWVRPANPSGEQIYSMDLVDGDTSNVETGRPGENPEDVDPNIEDVYLDVSNLKPGQAGVIAYNIAATFAHNTGRIFIGDPSGLSDIAVRRRLENMISTALKFGTTNHIAPHPRQVKGAAGVPPLKWVYGDSLGNIRRMIDASLKAGENSGKPQLAYDTRTGNFSEEPARSALDAAGGRLEQVSGPAAGGLPRVQSAAESGIRTNKRAAIFRALLREASEGRGGAQRGRDGILAGLVRVMDQFPGATKGIFYSRGSAVAGQPGVTPPGGTPPATSAAQPNAWDLPTDTRTDRIIYELQDGRVDLKRVQQAIKDAGNQIDELWDARLAETLYPGRVAHRSKQFLDAEVKPLLQAMALNKVEMDELSDYLHARGAEERNAQIAKVNPAMPDGGSGKNSKGVLMTNQSANAYLATIGQSRKAVLDALAKRVDAITGGTRKLLVSEGLEKQETIDAWEKAYTTYVPMFRDEAESGTPHPQGTGFAVKGSASKRATGSTKQVTNMLAHVLMQREAAITRAEKNHVAMALYGLALSNPNPEFWTTIRPGMSDAKITAELQGMGVNPAAAMAGMERAPTIRTVDEATGKVVDRPNPMYRNLPGAIPLKVNGEDRVLMLNVEEARGQRLADNLKNLDGLTRLDIAGSIVGKTTRWLAAVNTQYDPVFGLKNVVRDVLGGTINLGSTELRGNALKVLRDTTPAMQGIARELAMPGKGGTWGKLWQQFQEDGGKTGWKENWRDPQERARAIEAELKAASSAGKLTPGKAAHAIFDLLDGFNTTLENSVRLSAYKAALDKGMSRAEAARLGRELTVDFNRKGRAGREISPLYAFFNASVQGTARTLETLKGPTGAKVIAGGLGLGILQALMLAMAGYDDDEIQEFVKAREFIIPLGVDEKGVKQHVKIPLPLGLHAIPNTGRILTEMALSGGKDLGAKSFKAVAEMAAAMNPLGGGDVTTLPGALTTLAPTVIDPLLELGFNKNFAGNAIEREKFRETDTRPGAARVKESTQRSTTGQAYLGISEAINAMTGGTKYEAGVISPTPERLRYLAQTVGGGVLRETEKIINGLTNTEPLKPNQIPVVGSFYGEVDDAQVQASRYFRNKDKTESAESSFEAMKKEGDGESMDRFIKDHPEVWNAKMLGRIQESITKMNKLAVTVINDPKTMKEIDETRTELMKLANEAVKEMEDAEANERGEGPTLGDRLRRRARKEVEPVN